MQQSVKLKKVDNIILIHSLMMLNITLLVVKDSCIKCLCNRNDTVDILSIIITIKSHIMRVFQSTSKY